MTPLDIVAYALALAAGIVVVYALVRYDSPQTARTLHLPVVPTKANPRCRTCAKFDLRAGQDIIAKQPVFKEVTSILTVAEVGYGYDLDKNGERKGLAGPKEAITYQWSDLGACTEHMDLRVASDSCDQYVERIE